MILALVRIVGLIGLGLIGTLFQADHGIDL